MTTSTATPSLVISEVFGPTVQGEGPAAGRRAVFIRLGGCNLTCGWRRGQDGLETVPGAWSCDTAYSWHGGLFDLRHQLTRMTLREVLAEVRARPASLVVLTGGEPLLQQSHGYALADLAGILAAEGTEVHVETNGTIAPTDLMTAAVRLFVVSPKLPNSGLTREQAISWEVLGRFAELAKTGRAAAKFVCRDLGDLADAGAVAATAGFPRESCWIMPEGTDAGTILAGLRYLTEPALALGFNVTGREHVMIWGEERGR